MQNHQKKRQSYGDMLQVSQSQAKTGLGNNFSQETPPTFRFSAADLPV
jgi:hypothetical protein